MNILEKFKETVVSVLPVMGIVLLLGVTVAKLPWLVLGRFVFGGILLIIGLTIFLMGVDLGIQPMGERCGAELTKRRSLPLLLVSAFVIGFMVTVAEPDIQVFATQVKSMFSAVNRWAFILVIAAGVGLFVMLGLLRAVIRLPLKIMLLIFYAVLFTLVVFSPENFIGVAFDSGGATTGPMTVPFILALGLGVSSVRAGSEEKDSFGLTGVTSIGPVVAVLVYGVILNAMGNATADTAATGVVAEAVSGKMLAPFGAALPHIIRESALSIAPLIFLFIVFQVTLLKMTKRQVIRLIIGFVYSFIGLTIFLVGVTGGFSETGKMLGEVLGQKACNLGGFWTALLLITGLILGAVVVCAEPAVWVLTEQVESVSGGTIKRKMLLLFLSAGSAIAIALALLRGVRGFSIRWILIPGYVIAFILMIFCPPLFTGIAFDSGGVASGPITSTFVLSFTLGAGTCGNGSDVFGVIALVAMTPLIAIQILGIIYNKRQKVGGKK